MKVAFVPLAKWLALGKVAAGEHPAYGWYYTRWLLLETIIMDAEAAFLTQLQGTQFLNLLWRGLGARVGSNTCIFASSLGCEFDLKAIGDDVVLQYQSLVFGHSIEHHSLLLRPRRSRTARRSGHSQSSRPGPWWPVDRSSPPTRPFTPSALAPSGRS